MSTGESSGPIHPVPTRRSGYRYLFYDKHHGLDRHAARWVADLSQGEEFLVFDEADFHDLSDDRGCLYGVRPRVEGRIPKLGTKGEQVAEFPRARPNQPWHGYPAWPLGGERHGPPKRVFQKMEDSGLLSTRDRKRLEKGKNA